VGDDVKSANIAGVRHRKDRHKKSAQVAAAFMRAESQRREMRTIAEIIKLQFIKEKETSNTIRYAENETMFDDGYTIDRAIFALRQIRISTVSEEYEIHQIVADHLLATEIPFSREYSLGAHNRIDFFVPGGIGIEIKKGMPPHALLMSQLERYANFDEIQAIILVVERKATVPDIVNGKPCVLVSLNKLWGIAL
jgi:hypothetical protein